MKFLVFGLSLMLLSSIFPTHAMARDGLCGTQENVASVVETEDLDLLFVGSSATVGESATVYASSDGKKFIVTIEYPEEVCLGSGLVLVS